MLICQNDDNTDFLLKANNVNLSYWFASVISLGAH